MKYLLCTLILLLLSCSQEGEDTGSSPMAKLNSKFWYHAGTFDLNLKGPVREVVRKKYKLEGDTLSFQITEIDTLGNVKGDNCHRFNRDGYLTYVENYYYNSSFSEDITDTVVKKFQYNGANVLIGTKQTILTTTTYRDKKKDPKQRSENYNCQTKYRGDSIKMISNETKKCLEETVVKKGDTSVTYSWSPSNGAKGEKVTFSQREDGQYYKSKNEYNDITELVEYEFKEKQLHTMRVCQIYSPGDTLKTEYQYNSHRDYISSRETNGPEVDSPYNERVFRYVYDKHNNWIEMITFINGEARRLICREISYWE